MNSIIEELKLYNQCILDNNHDIITLRKHQYSIICSIFSYCIENNIYKHSYTALGNNIYYNFFSDKQYININNIKSYLKFLLTDNQELDSI